MILKGAETMSGKEFKEALVNKDLELLRKIPKTDLHNHSGLGMRFLTFDQWCGGNIKPPPGKINGLFTNTDDLLLFNRSVSEEFIYVYDSGLLGADELNEIRLNGFR